MPSLHSSVGHLYLTGKHVLGLADSDDPGDQPDAATPVATVTITPSVSEVVVLADESVVSLVPVVAGLNAEGQFVAPPDGSGASGGTGTSTSIKLIAPDQATINKVGWHWTVTVSPVSPGAFQPITAYVTGAPNETKTFGGQILAGQVPSLDLVPTALEVTGTGPGDSLTLGDIPPGTPSGTIIVNTAVTPPTVYLYR